MVVSDEATAEAASEDDAAAAGGVRRGGDDNDLKRSSEPLEAWLVRLLATELDVRRPERSEAAEAVRLLKQPHVMVLEDGHPVGYAELVRYGGVVEVRTVLVDPARRGEGWSHELLVEVWSRWMQDPILNGVEMPAMPADPQAAPKPVTTAATKATVSEDGPDAAPPPAPSSVLQLPGASRPGGAKSAILGPDGQPLVRVPSAVADDDIERSEAPKVVLTSEDDAIDEIDLAAADAAASRSSPAETGAEHLRHQLGRRAEGRDLIAFTRSPALAASLHAAGFRLRERKRRWWSLWLRRSLLGHLSTIDALSVAAGHTADSLGLLFRGEPLPPRTVRRGILVRWLQRRRRLFHQLEHLGDQRLFVLERAEALTRAPPRRRIDPEQQERSLAAHMHQLGMTVHDGQDFVPSEAVSATEAELEAWDLHGTIEDEADPMPLDPTEDESIPLVDLTQAEPPETATDDE